MASNNIQQEGMLPVGTILRGTYRVDGYLSSGGFGNTYKVTNVEFDEQYAIKEFFMRGVNQRDAGQTTVTVSNTANRTSFEEQREKFKKEARRLRQLSNSHVVRVHDLFDENGTSYYVMDFIDGESLSDRLKRTGQPIPETEVRNYLLQILDGLEEIHNKGFQHLDLKPANIMVDKQGNITIIDFGASKQMRPDGGATASTAICYTPGYAPREQMEQNVEKFGPWTDLYALGGTLYNILTTNKPPMPSDIDDEGEKAFSFPSTVTDEMRSYIRWLMQPNRTKRPQKVMRPTRKKEETEKAERKVYTQTSSVESIGEETIVAKPVVKPVQKPKLIPKPEPPKTLTKQPVDDYNNGSKIFWWIFLPAAIVVFIIVGINNCEGKSSARVSETYDTTVIDSAIDDTVLAVVEELEVDNESMYDAPEVSAEFPGDVYAWLSQNIKYPRICAERGIWGRVSVQFVINTDGSITNAEVLRTPDENLSKEALRVVKSMPRWNPARQGNKIVRQRYVLPVFFRID